MNFANENQVSIFNKPNIPLWLPKEAYKNLQTGTNWLPKCNGLDVTDIKT